MGAFVDDWLLEGVGKWVKFTPKGLAYSGNWGTLRHVGNALFLMKARAGRGGGGRCCTRAACRSRRAARRREALHAHTKALPHHCPLLRARAQAYAKGDPALERRVDCFAHAQLKCAPTVVLCPPPRRACRHAVPRAAGRTGGCTAAALNRWW